MASPPSCLPSCCSALPAPLDCTCWACSHGHHCPWRETSAHLHCCSKQIKDAPPTHQLHGESALQPWAQEVGMASKDAALYKTNAFLWPKWGQGTHCSRYLLVVKSLMWSLKVQVETLFQSELEITSSVFRNWKNQTIGKKGLLLSLDPAAAVGRVLWQHFILPSGQDASFLLC